MSDDPITVLDEAECWRLLGAAELGRLAVAAAGEVDIFPINYVVSEGVLYFRTAPGDKLLELTVNPTVAFEIDGYDESSAFSVVLKGIAERIESQTLADELERLPLNPWAPNPKYRWVRIVPTSVSGRSFLRTGEPERG